MAVLVTFSFRLYYLDFMQLFPKLDDVRPWGLYQPFVTQEEIFVKRRGEIIKFLHWQLWDPSRKQQKLKNAFLNDVSVTFKQSFQKYHFSPISGIFWKCYLGFFFLSNFSVKLTLFSVFVHMWDILTDKMYLGPHFLH